MRNVFYLVILLLATLCCGRKQEEKPTQGSVFRKYLIVDDNYCLHKRKTCAALRDSTYCIQYIDTLDLVDSDFDWYCARCINSQDYEHIQRILDR